MHGLLRYAGAFAELALNLCNPEHLCCYAAAIQAQRRDLTRDPRGRSDAMSQIRTNAAAAMLGVSANTLRGWERRYGHPLPRRTEGGHRIFELEQIEALRDALIQAGDPGAAIAIARERGEGPSTPQRLMLAFAEFNEANVDRLLEESLLVRSLERTVQDVLLAGVKALVEGSPERCFAWGYATGWLAAAKRIAPRSSCEKGVMVFDSSSEGSLDALHAQALELLLRRAGLRTLSLPLRMREERVGNALRALKPDALVLAGAGSDLHAVGQLMHAVRQACGNVEICDFRGAVPDTGASTMLRLGDAPIVAAQRLRERLIAPLRAKRLAS
jgi:MerR family transcriptional regulator, light-induced transcriptional regulator